MNFTWQKNVFPFSFRRQNQILTNDFMIYWVIWYVQSINFVPTWILGNLQLGTLMCRRDNLSPLSIGPHLGQSFLQFSKNSNLNSNQNLNPELNPELKTNFDLDQLQPTLVGPTMGRPTLTWQFLCWRGWCVFLWVIVAWNFG